MSNSLFIPILGSTLIATIVGFLLNWLKEYFQTRKEKEERRYEKLYGPMAYQLLAMKVLKINRMELIAEISKEPIPPDPQDHIKKYSEVVPLIDQWNEHRVKLRQLIEENAGYIKKSHLNLIEDFLDGWVKRDITKNLTSPRTTDVRIEKMISAIEALQGELLGSGIPCSGLGIMSAWKIKNQLRF